MGIPHFVRIIHQLIDCRQGLKEELEGEKESSQMTYYPLPPFNGSTQLSVDSRVNEQIISTFHSKFPPYLKGSQ